VAAGIASLTAFHDGNYEVGNVPDYIVAVAAALFPLLLIITTIALLGWVYAGMSNLAHADVTCGSHRQKQLARLSCHSASSIARYTWCRNWLVGGAADHRQPMATYRGDHRMVGLLPERDISVEHRGCYRSQWFCHGSRPGRLFGFDHLSAVFAADCPGCSRRPRSMAGHRL